MIETLTGMQTESAPAKGLGAERRGRLAIAPDEDPIDALGEWLEQLEQSLTPKEGLANPQDAGLLAALARMAQVKEKFVRLQQFVGIETEPLGLPAEFSLVSLRCQPSMRALLKSLQARRRMLQELTRVADKVLAMQQRVLNHRESSLYAYFSVQRVRRAIRDVDQKFKSLIVDDLRGKKILAGIFGDKIETKDLQVNQVLLKALDDLHGSERQTTIAKQELTKVEARLAKMQSWLKEQEFEMAKATAFDYPFEIDRWPRKLRTQFGEVVKEAKHALQTYQVAQKYQSMSRKRNNGPVIPRIISEEKI